MSYINVLNISSIAADLVSREDYICAIEIKNHMMIYLAAKSEYETGKKCVYVWFMGDVQL